MQDATEDGVVPAPGPAPPQPNDPDAKKRFNAWYRKWLKVAKRRGKDTKGSEHWFGRVATTERETKPWKGDYEKIDEALVRNWIWQQRSHRDDDELGFSLLAQVLADEITNKLRGDQAARKKLLKALPLITRPSLRRDRLRLGRKCAAKACCIDFSVDPFVDTVFDFQWCFGVIFQLVTFHDVRQQMDFLFSAFAICEDEESETWRSRVGRQSHWNGVPREGDWSTYSV